MNRSGFTLVEVIVAMMLLGVTIVGMQLVTVAMLRNQTSAHVRLTASQLAEDRLDRVRLEPNYGALSNYQLTEDTVPGFPGFRRVTEVRTSRDSTARGIVDYREITVRVMSPSLPAPIVRSLIIGAP